MYGYIDRNVERLISNYIDAFYVIGMQRVAVSDNKQYGECIEMNIITKISSLIAIILLASGISAMGAESSVGSGNDDWWTAYPDQSSGAGGDVNHPSWVLDALRSKPVLIYVHKSCSYCAPQTLAVKNITDEFNGQITFFDIGADGSDARSEEALQVYDPNGGKMYVPLTVLLTLAPNSEGEVVPVWHSTDEVTGDAWIKKYVEGALSQYNEFSADWNM
jgi:hypothetical protein